MRYMRIINEIKLIKLLNYLYNLPVRGVILCIGEVGSEETVVNVVNGFLGFVEAF